MANPVPTANDTSPYGDAVARLTGIRQALALADANGAGPAPDFDPRSEQVIGAAAAGLDALLATTESAASRGMVDRIRRELAEISSLVLNG